MRQIASDNTSLGESADSFEWQWQKFPCYRPPHILTSHSVTTRRTEAALEYVCAATFQAFLPRASILSERRRADCAAILPQVLLTYVLTCLVGAIVIDRGGPGREVFRSLGDGEEKTDRPEAAKGICVEREGATLGACLNFCLITSTSTSNMLALQLER